MSEYSFDDLAGTLGAAKNKHPVWAINLDKAGLDDKTLLNWLITEIHYLENTDQDRRRELEQNLTLYKGHQRYYRQTRQDVTREYAGQRSKFQGTLVVNHLYDMVQNKTAKLIKYKPAVQIIPTNDEIQDKVASKLTKALLDHIWYKNDIDAIVRQTVRDSKVLGEGYIFIEWDPSKGDIHPDFEKDRMLPLLDENGDVVVDHNGNKVMIESAVKVGDVSFRRVLATDVFIDRVKDYRDAKYIIRKERMSVEAARFRYPGAADKIKADSQAKDHLYDDERAEEAMIEETCIFHMYYKRCEELPAGRYIVFTRHGIIINEENPYSMEEEFPCSRITDIEIPGELHARSFFMNTKHLAAQYNNLTSMIVRNHALVAHPKWVMPAGSAKVESLGNDITIVQYKGAVPPQLVSASPTPNEVFKFREQLKEDMIQIAGIHGVSRGEPPSGIHAGVALQFMSEQEHERQNNEIANFNAFIRDIAKKTLAVAGDYYDPSDKRMIRVVGRNNDWQTVYFDAVNLSKSYDVRVQNASALPESKAARTQYLLDISERWPDLLSQEQLIDMLDLGHSEKFSDIVTSAVTAAEAENEEMGEGKRVQAPESWEHHVVHWKIHAQDLQKRSFKTQSTKRVQELKRDHLLAHEYLMYEQAKKNPSYQEQLLKLEQFPLLYNPEEPVTPDTAIAAPETVPPQVQPLPEGLPTDLTTGELVAPQAPPVGAGLESPVEVPELSIPSPIPNTRST